MRPNMRTLLRQVAGGRVAVRLTFAGLVVDADGLRLVVAVVVLDAHQVGVGAVVETRPHGQHVLVGLVHGLHQLQKRPCRQRHPCQIRPEAPEAAAAHSRLNTAACLSLIAAATSASSM